MKNPTAQKKKTIRAGRVASVRKTTKLQKYRIGDIVTLRAEPKDDRPEVTLEVHSVRQDDYSGNTMVSLCVPGTYEEVVDLSEKDVDETLKGPIRRKLRRVK